MCVHVHTYAVYMLFKRCTMNMFNAQERSYIYTSRKHVFEEKVSVYLIHSVNTRKQ